VRAGRNIRRLASGWRLWFGAASVACLAGLLLAATAQASESQDAMQPSRQKAHARLGQVERWGCQYQHIDPALIAGSPLDLIVIDPILDGGAHREAGPDDIAAMQHRPDGGRRLVIAYLSVGAAAEYRPYWQPEWTPGAPQWLGPENPEWPLSHTVRFWDPQWREIVTGELKAIVAAGFDGVFLDRVDAFHDWRRERAEAPDNMADLIVHLAETARNKRPDFLLIGQNADDLLAIRRYRDAIDAVSKESLLTGLQGQGVNNRPDQIAWSMNYLVPAQQSGLTILTIEYMEGHGDRERIGRRHRAMGFVPFFGTRLLDRLP
jgi:cysteinyl-tRNA synthetase, unknown class